MSPLADLQRQGGLFVFLTQSKLLTYGWSFGMRVVWESLGEVISGVFSSGLSLASLGLSSLVLSGDGIMLCPRFMLRTCYLLASS